MGLYKNEANLSNLSFWGLIFLGNYLIILLIIVAFWIGSAGAFKLNLVYTLWILAFAAPITLVTMNFGLTPENCHVSGFFNPVDKDKKKK